MKASNWAEMMDIVVILMLAEVMGVDGTAELEWRIAVEQSVVKE